MFSTGPERQRRPAGRRTQRGETMTQDVHDTLASWFDSYAVEGQLHDVPPHAVHEVTVDGRRAVCKVARGETADVGAEAAAMAHADRHTDLPVPSVVAADEDAFVASWVDGLPDEDAAPDAGEVTDAYARALGRTLARLHAATADAFPRPGFPRLGGAWGPGDPAGSLVVDAHEDWHAVARDYVAEARAYLADIGRADPADEVLALLDDRPDLFAGAGTPVLCHGNLLPDHVGFERDAGDPVAVAAVIDFEHAMVAPAEYDLWRTALPVFFRGSPTPDPAYEAFREGYGSVRPLPHGVERRRDAWVVVTLVSYLVALDVQNRGIGPDERPRAEGMAEKISETAADLRSR
ncbi:aminoglycoside phosphotransferase family protein [Halobacteriales archaeon QH_8_68_33]|nr:MAG: aminoglycoside phosphotransferase family protein [Halobacteriales archaeon QH_8_68_33]